MTGSCGRTIRSCFDAGRRSTAWIGESPLGELPPLSPDWLGMEPAGSERSVRRVDWPTTRRYLALGVNRCNRILRTGADHLGRRSPVTGTLLAVARFTVPALTAQLWTDHISRAMLIAASGPARRGGPVPHGHLRRRRRRFHRHHRRSALQGADVGLAQTVEQTGTGTPSGSPGPRATGARSWRRRLPLPPLASAPRCSARSRWSRTPSSPRARPADAPCFCGSLVGRRVARGGRAHVPEASRCL